PLVHYVARLVAATDPQSEAAPDFVRKALRFGAGVRGGQSIVLAAKARALLLGRPNVSFEDLRAVAPAALRHRLLTSYAGEADGTTPDEVVHRLLASIPERSDV